jgi:hypothetical protein
MNKVVQMLDPLVGIEMRMFELDQEAEAWHWLNS